MRGETMQTWNYEIAVQKSDFNFHENENKVLRAERCAR